MKRRLILHVGTHKTGTTSFQQSLRANEHALIERGVHPLSISVQGKGDRRGKKRNFNCQPLAHMFLRPEVATIARLVSGKHDPEGQPRTQRYKELLRLIRRVRAPVLIVSAEAFSFMRTPEERAAIREFFKAAGRSLEVVMVFRHDEGWRASWNNQLEKRPEVWQATQALPDRQKANGDWYFDQGAIYDFWSGIAPVSVVDYDEQMKEHANIIPGLYRAMGIDPAGLKTDFVKNIRVEIS